MSDTTPTRDKAPATAATASKKPTGESTSQTTTPGEVAGKNTIEQSVVAKIIGIATRDVAGVYGVGGGAARAIGAIRDAINQTDLGQGISVEVGEKQVAADITIVVEYPNPLHQVANAVRTAVAQAITELVGLEVAEVNVNVTDVHIPATDEADAGPASETAATESRVK